MQGSLGVRVWLQIEPGYASVDELIDLILEMYRTAHVGERYPDKKPQRYFRGHEVFTAEQLTRGRDRQRHLSLEPAHFAYPSSRAARSVRTSVAPPPIGSRRTSR